MSQPPKPMLKRQARLRYEFTRLPFYLKRLWPVLKKNLLSGRIPRVPAELIEQHRITVVLGHLNRAGRRLENCLQSLRGQDLPDRCFELCVVDLGSRPEVLEELRQLADRYRLRLILANQEDATWSRSFALNLGIRHSDPAAEYVAFADADCLYTPNYLRTMIAAQLVFGGAMCFSDAFELPERLKPEDIDMAQIDWRGATEGCKLFGFGGGATQCLPRAWLERVGAYDERFGGWGMQDLDLWNRARREGMVTVSVFRWAYCLHQWHPSGRTLPSEEFTRRVEITWGDQTIVRNPGGWGELPPGGQVIEPRPA